MNRYLATLALMTLTLTTAAVFSAEDAKSPAVGAKKDAPRTAEDQRLEAKLLFQVGNDKFQKGQDAYEGLLGETDPVPLLKAAALSFETLVRNYSGEDRAADGALLLGTTYLLLEEMEKALAAYESAYTRYPAFKDRHLALLRTGICQAGLGDPQKAKATFERYLKEFPDRTGEVLKVRKFIQELSIVGRPAPPVLPARWLQGVAGPDGLKAFENQVVVLVFFATWCPNCRKELPHLRSITKKWASSDVVFIAVVNPNDPQGKVPVEAYVQDNRLEFTDVALDSATSTWTPYRVTGFPAAAVIDRKGTVRWRGHLGFFPSPLVKKLLEEGTAKP